MLESENEIEAAESKEPEQKFNHHHDHHRRDNSARCPLKAA